MILSLKMSKDDITSEKSSSRCLRFRCSSGKYEWGWKAGHSSKGKIDQELTCDNGFIKITGRNNDLDHGIVHGFLDNAKDCSSKRI